MIVPILALLVSEPPVVLEIPRPDSAPPRSSEVIDSPKPYKFLTFGPEGKILQAYFSGCLDGGASQIPSTARGKLDEVVEVCFNKLRNGISGGLLPKAGLNLNSYDVDWLLLEPKVQFEKRLQEK